MKKQFQIEKTENGKTIRIYSGMRIKNNFIRRIIIILQLPFMLLFNIVMPVIVGIPAAIFKIISIIYSNSKYSFIRGVYRWNTYKND